MAVKFSTGVQFAVAQTYGTPSNVTAASTAANCVVTVADGTTFVVGDIVEFTSGWEAANNRLFRISAKSTNDLTLEGLNTTNTTRFPSGGGVGSLREITAWSNITQVRNVTPQASTNEFEDISTVSNANIIEVPVAQRLGGVTLELLDDPLLSFVAIVENAADTIALTGVRIVFPDASRILANGYLTYSKVPSIPTRGALTNSIEVKYASVPTRYNT
jgi:hypothetical protein